jgi:hypothetical protein
MANPYWYWYDFVLSIVACAPASMKSHAFCYSEKASVARWRSMGAQAKVRCAPQDLGSW